VLFPALTIKGETVNIMQPPRDPGKTVAYPDFAAAYDRLFRPSSIAVLGASDNNQSPGGTVYANLRRDFPGTLFAVNARRDTVQGDRAFRSLDEVPAPVDLAVVITPALEVPGLIRRCIDRGDGAALVISSGFAEAGGASPGGRPPGSPAGHSPGGRPPGSPAGSGTEAQAAISELASAAGFPVLGPNCIGFMNRHAGVMANFSLRPDADRPEPGPVALVSQSGGFGSYILEKAIRASVRVGLFVSTGNEADVTVARVLRYLVERPDVSTLLTFCEALRDPALFLEAADRAVELGKVIVALKTGDSEATARAALSHTASIVGSAEVFDAVCAQYGVLKAVSIEEMVDLGLVLQGGRRMSGRRIGITTPSGGAGVLVADAASKAGLEVPALPAADRALITPHIPGFGSALNPIDLTAQLTSFPPDSYGRILDAVAGCEVIDAVLPVTWLDEGDAADAIRRVYQEQAKPVVSAITVGGIKLGRDGIPTLPDPTRAVRALACLAEVSTRPRPEAGRRAVRTDPRRAARARDLLSAEAGRPFVLEAVAKQVLALYGVPVSKEVVVHDADEAARAAETLGGRVALKALSYALPHKSDQGGLRLGVKGGTGAAKAYLELVAALTGPGRGLELQGVLVQQMVPATIEIMCGLDRDPVFGPVVAAGLGGALVEVLGDPVLLRAPFTLIEAERAARAIAGGRITHPVRGLDDGQLTALAEAMVGIGTMAVELPEVASADVNPFRVSGTGFCAVDALLVVSGAGP